MAGIILGILAAATGLVNTLVSGGTGTNIGDMTALGGLAAAFDGTTSQNDAASACAVGTLDCYVGKTYSSGKIIGKVIIFPSNQSGSCSAGTNITFNLRGKTSVPGSASDGTLLGTITRGRSLTTSFTITSTVFTSFTNVWVEMVPDSSGNTLMAELQIYELL